jgi:hypothetical protein
MGETRRIIEALLISAAQRAADVAAWTALFTDQAARQQQTADALDKRLRVHGVADGETRRVSMLGGGSMYEQVTRADAEVYMAIPTCVGLCLHFFIVGFIFCEMPSRRE